MQQPNKNTPSGKDISSISIKKLVSYDQSNYASDRKTGGNCFAYSCLFLVYVSMFSFKNNHASIDYGCLQKALEEFPAELKNGLNDMQNKEYFRNNGEIDFKKILHLYSIALFHTIQTNYDLQSINKFCLDIEQHINHFTTPKFFFLHFDDTKLNIGHSVIFYLPSPNELHFFDANNGLYIFEWSKKISAGQLEEKILDLLFPKHWLFGPSRLLKSPTLEYSYFRLDLLPPKKLNKGLMPLILCTLKEFMQSNQSEKEFFAANPEFAEVHKICFHFIFMLQKQRHLHKAEHPLITAEKLTLFASGNLSTTTESKEIKKCPPTL